MDSIQRTFMFTDIVGYSKLMEHDEAQTIYLLEEYQHILYAQINKHGGSINEYIGDAMLANFESPEDAVQAGLAIQQALKLFNLEVDPLTPKLQSRIGIHSGVATPHEGTFLGDDVNIASRLETLGSADCLCVSEDVYEKVKTKLGVPVLPLGVQPLKNIDKNLRAFLICPDGIPAATRSHYFQRKLNHKIQENRYTLLVILGLLILSGLYFIPQWLESNQKANYVEIADFTTLQPDKTEVDYFSAGISQALSSQLAEIDNLYIIDTEEGARGTIRVEGSVKKTDNSLNLIYRLLRRQDGVQIAYGTIDGDYDQLFDLQDQLATEVAGYLSKEYKTKLLRPDSLNLTNNLQAYDAYLLGLKYLRSPGSNSNFLASVNSFKEALQLDKNFALANAGLCNAYTDQYEAHKSTKLAAMAEKYCLLALQQDNTLSEVYEALGTHYRDTGRLDEALELLKKARKIDPSNVNAILALANTYRAQNNLPLAEQTFKYAIRLFPNYWLSYSQLAAHYFSQGKHQQAIDLYLQALEIIPENTFILNNIGAAYLSLGNMKKAAEAFDHVTRIQPDKFAYSNIGTMYYFDGDFEKSSKMFEEAVRLAPDDYRMYANLADALRQVPGQQAQTNSIYGKAIELALDHLSINNKDIDALQILAHSYMRTDSMHKAETYLTKASDVNPDHTDYLLTCVYFYAASSSIDRALEFLAKLHKAGYPVKVLQNDPDLKLLQNLPEYQQFMGIVSQ